MPNKLEVGDLGSVLDQPPHVLSVGLVDVIVDRFQVQTIHLKGRGSPETRKLTAQLGERQQTAGPQTRLVKHHNCRVGQWR